eukprot:361138_1
MFHLIKTFIPILTFIYFICCLSNGDKLYADTGQQKNDIILLPNGMVNSISTNYKSTDKICKTITKELSFINLLKEIYDKNEVVSEEEDKNDEAKEEEQIFCDGQTCDQCSAIYDGVSLDPCRIEYVSLFCNGKDYPNSCMTEENGVDKLTETQQTCNRIDPMGCDIFYAQKDGFQDDVNGCTKRKCDGGELEKASSTESICDSGLNNKSKTECDYNGLLDFDNQFIEAVSNESCCIDDDNINYKYIGHDKYDKEREFFRFDINKYIREEQIFCNGQTYANPCLTESKSDKCFMDTFENMCVYSQDCVHLCVYHFDYSNEIFNTRKCSLGQCHKGTHEYNKQSDQLNKNTFDSNATDDMWMNVIDANGKKDLESMCDICGYDDKIYGRDYSHCSETYFRFLYLTRPGGDKIRIDKSIIRVDDYSSVSLRGDINDDGLGSLPADATVNDICIKTNAIPN